MSDDEDFERLPPAHPRFAAHFTHRVYDPDDYENDELPPFGSDEGSDEIHDWAERLDELRQNPTLRYMLGDDADEQISELASTFRGRSRSVTYRCCAQPVAIQAHTASTLARSAGDDNRFKFIEVRSDPAVGDWTLQRQAGDN